MWIISYSEWNSLVFFFFSFQKVPGPGSYDATFQTVMPGTIMKMGKKHGIFFSSAFQTWITKSRNIWNLSLRHFFFMKEGSSSDISRNAFHSDRMTSFMDTMWCDSAPSVIERTIRHSNLLSNHFWRNCIEGKTKEKNTKWHLMHTSQTM